MLGDDKNARPMKFVEGKEGCSKVLSLPMACVGTLFFLTYLVLPCFANKRYLSAVFMRRKHFQWLLISMNEKHNEFVKESHSVCHYYKDYWIIKYHVI